MFNYYSFLFEASHKIPLCIFAVSLCTLARVDECSLASVFNCVVLSTSARLVGVILQEQCVLKTSFDFMRNERGIFNPLSGPFSIIQKTNTFEMIVSLDFHCDFNQSRVENTYFCIFKANNSERMTNENKFIKTIN